MRSSSEFCWPTAQRVVWIVPMAPARSSTVITAESLASSLYLPMRSPLALWNVFSRQFTLAMSPAG